MTTDHPHPLHPRVVVPVRIGRDGRAGPTRGETAGPLWRRTSRGLVVPSWVDPQDPDQRIVEAAAVVPSYGGVTGWAGLRWAGASWFAGRDGHGDPRPVVLAVMHGEIRSQPGFVVTSERLRPRDLTTHDGLPITTPVRSVCFEMRYAPSDRDAVVILDMALMDDVVSLGEVADYVAELKGWIGVGRCRAALVLADENSWSAQETWLRLIWVVDLELPRPLCNQPVFDLTGQHVGTPDLLDVEAGVVIEYEGGLHLDRRRRGRDLQKEAAYRRLGLEYVVMVAADIGSPETTIIPRLVQARRRARFEAPTRRSWTLQPPGWWISTTTVAARRALTASQRERLLRYRSS